LRCVEEEEEIEDVGNVDGLGTWPGTAVYEEVMLARQGGREESENKWEVLRTRIMAGEEDRHAARSAKRKAQQERRCWRCGEEGHCLWACPKKAAHPGKGKAQQEELRGRIEEKEGVKRKWHREEIQAANRGWLVSRNERGWITNSRTDWVVSVVSCGCCGEKGISKGTNYVRMDYAHDM